MAFVETNESQIISKPKSQRIFRLVNMDASETESMKNRKKGLKCT